MYRTCVLSGFILILLASCGEVNTIIPSETVYKVSLKTASYTLEECAVLTSSVPVSPFFIQSDNNDSDIRKLTVFLQSVTGTVLSRKFAYVLDPDKAAADVSSGIAETQEKTASSGTDAVSRTVGASGEGAPSGVAVDSEDDLEASKNDTAASSGADAVSRTTGASGKGASSGIAADNSEDDLEASTDDAPASIEAGEDLKAYRFAKKNTGTAVSSPSDEDIIYIKKFTDPLPPFLLPDDIVPGQYVIVFQISGENSVLNRIEKPFYYIGRSKFSLSDINLYMPGVFDSGNIVPPDVPVMLETAVSSGEGLDPYIIWYNGKKRIYEGFVAGGAARFIWSVPGQSGFYSVKAEVFPFRPMNIRQPPAGQIKELSLPVAVKKERVAVGMAWADFEEKALSVLRNYSLFANLEETVGSGPQAGALVALGHIPEWLPGSGIFGLAVGPGRSFVIPGPMFSLSSPDSGENYLLFRFIPVSEGIIFKGSFKLNLDVQLTEEQMYKERFETVEVCLLSSGGMAVLEYSAGSVSGKKAVFLPFFQSGKAVTAAVGFEVTKDSLRLSLGLDVPAAFIPGDFIPLPGLLTGAGTFRLGAAADEKAASVKELVSPLKFTETPAFTAVPVFNIGDGGDDAAEGDDMEAAGAGGKAGDTGESQPETGKIAKDVLAAVLEIAESVDEAAAADADLVVILDEIVFMRAAGVKSARTDISAGDGAGEELSALRPSHGPAE
jgi:hypothetical protein